MAEKKITKVEMFKKVIEKVKDDAEMVAFLNHEIELLQRKTNNPSKKDKERKATDAAIAEAILTAMVDKKTVSEIIKTVPALMDFSTQKIAPILGALIKEGKVAKVTEKGKSLYSVVV